MASLILTPTLLDSHLRASPQVSPIPQRQSNIYETPLVVHSCVPQTRSSCGKVSVKLYPSFCGESETRAMSREVHEKASAKVRAELELDAVEGFSDCEVSTPISKQSAPKSKLTKKEIEKAQIEIAELIARKKYKQAMSKLFTCERATSKDHPLFLKLYTKYLIVLVYYKTHKYTKCIDAAIKASKDKYEFDTLATQYVRHMRYLWGKSLCGRGEYKSAVEVLEGVVKECEGKENGVVFSGEHLLMAKGDLGECYMVSSVLIG
eukprot:TRINITY_DN2088_c0_g3_i2.p2 TRINITY_DN2088_c0_g3~~TRINITY_DN2088_c0_g3_i2.p2  ORF type:complete len:263 (+),score=71.37 TRINITY_DN2088_c0_g3_i2:129-917(+)